MTCYSSRGARKYIETLDCVPTASSAKISQNVDEWW